MQWKGDNFYLLYEYATGTGTKIILYLKYWNMNIFHEAKDGKIVAV